MKKYKLTLTPELALALVSTVDKQLSIQVNNLHQKMIHAGLVELKEKLVSKSFMQQDKFRISLSHVQALSLCSMVRLQGVPVFTQAGSFLLKTSNEIAQKYSV